MGVACSATHRVSHESLGIVCLAVVWPCYDTMRAPCLLKRMGKQPWRGSPPPLRLRRAPHRLPTMTREDGNGSLPPWRAAALQRQVASAERRARDAEARLREVERPPVESRPRPSKVPPLAVPRSVPRSSTLQAVPPGSTPQAAPRSSTPQAVPSSVPPAPPKPPAQTTTAALLAPLAIPKPPSSRPPAWVQPTAVYVPPGGLPLEPVFPPLPPASPLMLPPPTLPLPAQPAAPETIPYKAMPQRLRASLFSGKAAAEGGGVAGRDQPRGRGSRSHDGERGRRRRRSRSRRSAGASLRGNVAAELEGLKQARRRAEKAAVLAESLSEDARESARFAHMAKRGLAAAGRASSSSSAVIVVPDTEPVYVKVEYDMDEGCIHCVVCGECPWTCFVLRVCQRRLQVRNPQRPGSACFVSNIGVLGWCGDGGAQAMVNAPSGPAHAPRCTNTTGTYISRLASCRARSAAISRVADAG